MRVRLAAVLCAALMLTGCSLPSLSNLLSFSDDSDAGFPGQNAAPPAVASTAPAGAPGAPDPFCASVAQQDALDGGFDQATQQRMAMRSYQQCMAMYRGQ